jgi:hypothetical protein
VHAVASKPNIIAFIKCRDRKTKTEIAEELNATPVLDKIQNYK